jgi:hypothetical protein
MKKLCQLWRIVFCLLLAEGLIVLGCSCAFSQDTSDSAKHTTVPAPTAVTTGVSSGAISHGPSTDSAAASQSGETATPHDHMPFSNWTEEFKHRSAKWRDLDNIPEEELRKRPLLYWRRWANKPPHVVAMSLFFFVSTLVLGEVFKTTVATARQWCRKQFWRSLGRGICAVCVLLVFVRPLILSEIGIPLALLLLALVELLLIAGLAVSASLLAEALLSRASLSSRLMKRPFLYRFCLALVGAIMLGFVLAIPGVGLLPPIGIRIVALIAELGAGGLVKALFDRRPS